jgi:ABC-type sugar transport system substrate-binding protein
MLRFVVRCHRTIPTACRFLATLSVAVAITASGCDSSSTFLPPPPDGLRGAAAEDSVSSVNVPVPPRLENAFTGARSVEMIFDRREQNEIVLIDATVRAQAGMDRVKFRTSYLGEKDPPTKQCDLVREAVARNALALVIEPADPTDKKLAESIQNARNSGIPVVMLGRPLGEADSSKAATESSTSVAAKAAPSPAAASTGAKPLVVVAPPSFTDSARQLVASAIRNAKNAKLDPKGGALIVNNPYADSFVKERIAAIQSALTENGITAIDVFTSSESSEAGGKVLIEKLKSNPKLILVFAADGLSTSVARQALGFLIPERLFVVAAYPAEATYSDMTRVGDFAAVAGFVPMRLIRKALSTAVSISQGQAVPARVDFPIEVYDSAPTSTTAQSPIYYRAKSAAKAVGKSSP